MISDDHWLDNWRDHLLGRRILELGAGSGRDTVRLRKLADQLVSTDLQPKLELDIVGLDHSKPIPFPSESFDVVVASLCLHYFEWGLTKEIVSRLNNLLSPIGLLICRVNSSNDKNYGAIGHPQIEEGLFNVEGHKKRFFSKDDIVSLFQDHWKIESIEEKSIDRYEKVKVIWELSASKKDR